MPVADHMSRILALSGVSTTPYELPTIREFSSRINHLFDPQYFDEATLIAAEEQSMKLKTGRIQLFVPCNIDSLTPRHFEEMLLEPYKYQLTLGKVPTPGSPIYTNSNEAFLARKVNDEEHPGFMIYDPNAGVYVDLVGRDGKSQLSAVVRRDLSLFLRRQFEDDLSWIERPLYDTN